MPKTATIDLNGLIMPDDWIWFDSYGISLQRVQSLIDQAGEFDELTIYLDSDGGVIEEGWAIYDYLLSLDKPITVIGLGAVYSMATVLMLAGSTRLLSKHTKFMVHLPSGGGWGGNRLDIQQYLDDLIAEEKRIVDVYTAATGKEDSVIAELLADGKDHYFTAQEALDYGWTTGIYGNTQPATAKAAGHRKPVMAHLSEGRKALNLPEHKNPGVDSPKFDMSKVMKRANAAWESLKAAMSGKPMVNLAVETADGKKLSIETTGDGYVVGDAVTYDDGSAVPDGDYTLSDNNTITVKDGVISAITEPSADSIQTEETTTDGGVSTTETVASGDSEEMVTIPKAEYDGLKAKVTAIEAKQAKNDKLMNRIVAVLGTIESADPIQAKATETSVERRRPEPSATDPLARRREIEAGKKK